MTRLASAPRPLPSCEALLRHTRCCARRPDAPAAQVVCALLLVAIDSGTSSFDRGIHHGCNSPCTTLSRYPLRPVRFLRNVIRCPASNAWYAPTRSTLDYSFAAGCVRVVMGGRGRDHRGRVARAKLGRAGRVGVWGIGVRDKDDRWQIERRSWNRGDGPRSALHPCRWNEASGQTE